MDCNLLLTEDLVKMFTSQGYPCEGLKYIDLSIHLPYTSASEKGSCFPSETS